MADLLVVEDDPDASEALVAILRAHDHVVRIAYDGEHGLRLLSERLPELALLDVEMPVLDGPGMVVSMFIRDAGLERVPIVLLSGVPDLRAVAARVGTPYYLAKPFPFAALDEMIGRASRNELLRHPSEPAPVDPLRQRLFGSFRSDRNSSSKR